MREAIRELIRGHHSGDGCGTWAPSWARTEEALDELRVEGEHATKLGGCISAISG
jgi:hypothetical protein